MWAADCAEDVLTIFEGATPDDPRMRAAIAQTREFASGTLDVGDAIRRRGAQAGAAARASVYPAARAAAYAAEQAAAVAHLGAHALGAGGYALKAHKLNAPDVNLDDEADRLVSFANDAAAAALAALPVLGQSASGILGPGRLTSGLVGEGIRALQAATRARVGLPG